RINQNHRQSHLRSELPGNAALSGRRNEIEAAEVFPAGGDRHVKVIKGILHSTRPIDRVGIRSCQRQGRHGIRIQGVAGVNAIIAQALSPPVEPSNTRQKWLGPQSASPEVNPARRASPAWPVAAIDGPAVTGWLLRKETSPLI